MLLRILKTTAFVVMGISFSHAQDLKKAQTLEEIDYFNAHPEEFEMTTPFKTTNTNVMPSDARFPGEYEEAQAVAIGWPYSGNTLDTASSTARLWATMANAIQQECPVWIRLKNANDTQRLKTFMTNRGTPLVSYKFLFFASNAYWMRDFGPLGFYYSGDDSVGFLDQRYYTTRPSDDLFPAQLAGLMGYKNVNTNIFAEGGNYMTDGWKRSFHSSRIPIRNTQAYGWTPQQTSDSIHYYWASDSVTVTNELQCDGGTGHIDMYMKLVDEETFAIMEYPNVVTASDKGTIDTVIMMLSQKKSHYDRPYRIFKLPMPTRNDGSYNTACNAIDNDARTFVNGLLINKTYIMPAFSSATSGNKAGDSAAVATFQKILPGYNIVPIDSRNLTTQGGAIHCVTMQIPAENPLRIWHPALVDLQHFATSKHLIVKATNKSGIATVQANWRVKGVTVWNNVILADSAGYKIGDITGTYTINDTIEYYITATSNNGKSVVKPLTAPTGFYSFYFDPATVSASTLEASRNFVLNPVPNPSSGKIYLPVALETPRRVTSLLTDVMGRSLLQTDHGMHQQGMSKIELNFTELPAGVYFLQVKADQHVLATKKLVKE